MGSHTPREGRELCRPEGVGEAAQCPLGIGEAPHCFLACLVSLEPLVLGLFTEMYFV